MRYQSRDPYWLTAKFPAACRMCGVTVRKGERGWYWPSNRSIECPACGDTSERRFLAEVADEAAYCGGYGC